MSYIIPIGNGSFASANNGWFCVSNAVTRESLGYYSWIMVGYRIPGYLTQIAAALPMFWLPSLLLPWAPSYRAMPIGPKNKPIVSKPPKTVHTWLWALLPAPHCRCWCIVHILVQLIVIEIIISSFKDIAYCATCQLNVVCLGTRAGHHGDRGTTVECVYWM